jgi:hypothetical protein
MEENLFEAFAVWNLEAVNLKLVSKHQNSLHTLKLWSFLVLLCTSLNVTIFEVYLTYSNKIMYKKSGDEFKEAPPSTG